MRHTGSHLGRAHAEEDADARGQAGHKGHDVEGEAERFAHLTLRAGEQAAHHLRHERVVQLIPDGLHVGPVGDEEDCTWIVSSYLVTI